MSSEERKVQEIQQRRGQEDLDRQWTFGATRVVQDNADHLWTALINAVKSEVEKFSKLEPSAKDLRASMQNSRHLLVHTSQFPLVKLNIRRTIGGYVSADLTHIKHSMGVPEEWAPVQIYFGVDRNSRPCFEIDDSEGTPLEAAEALLDSTFRLFF